MDYFAASREFKFGGELSQTLSQRASQWIRRMRSDNRESAPFGLLHLRSWALVLRLRLHNQFRRDLRAVSLG